jgi:Flp pilus assembly pilin Flp
VWSWHNLRTLLRMAPPTDAPRTTLLRDTRGAVMSEYVVLVGTVSLTVSVAIAALGPPLVRSFEDTRDILLLPFP